MTEDQSIRWQKRTTSDIIEAVFTLHQTEYEQQRHDTELMKQVVHTLRTSRQSSWSKRFGALNSVLTPGYLLPAPWISFLALTYSLPLWSE